ncbi:MAG TPA: hypothetical protein VJQ82_00210 [Terriglobales bacterium]|nr:hypothetical protein [Terriglobales bacterium]
MRMTPEEEEKFVNDWTYDHDLAFFMVCGMEGGASRSPKKLAAARQNLIKANAARKAKAEERRRLQASQGQVPSDDPSGCPPND